MIPIILYSTRNQKPFHFSGPANKDYYLATIKDLNTVVQRFNNQLYFRPIDFMLTHNNQSNPTFKLLMAGVADCGVSCNCPDDCGCAGDVATPGCSKEGNPLIIPTPVRSSTGVYQISFALNHPDLVDNRGIAIWPAALANLTHRITVSKMVNNVITISTYDGAVLSDTILDETVFATKLYVK